MIDQKMLENIGLTGSEAKVYLALLKIGDFTSKKDILKHSKIAPSKVYHILDKLMDKGLVSTIIKNNVKHFAAAPPARIKDYIAEKKDQLVEEEKTAEALLPQLEGLYKSVAENTTAEIFIGWKGMETHYHRMAGELDKKDFVWTLGASKGEDQEKTQKFFMKFGKIYKDKDFKLRVLLNEDSRDYMRIHEKALGVYLEKRYLTTIAPVEVCIVKHMISLVILKKEPIVIVVRDKQTADAFKDYFEQLWKIAKK